MDLPVTEPRWLAAHGRWHGKVQFPDRRHATEILIFPLRDGLAGLRARCPHEGQDLSEVPLDGDGALVCPRHSLPVCLYGARSAAFRVERHADGFRIPWPLLLNETP